MNRTMAASHPTDATPATLPVRRVLLGAAIVLTSVLLGALLVWLAFALGRALRPAPALAGLALTPRPALGFSLSTPDGRVVTDDDFAGQFVLMTFGSTRHSHPGMLDTLTRVPALVSPPAEVAVVWVALDGAHDTPTSVAALLSPYGDAVTGLLGDPHDVETLAASYDVLLAGGSASQAPLYNTVAVLIDPQGAVRAMYPWGMAAEQIAADIDLVLTPVR